MEIKLDDKKSAFENSKKTVSNATIPVEKKPVRVINLNLDVKSTKVKENNLNKVTYDNKRSSENKVKSGEAENSNVKNKSPFNKLSKGRDLSVKTTDNNATKIVTIDLDDLENNNVRGQNRKISPMHLKLYESSLFNVSEYN